MIGLHSSPVLFCMDHVLMSCLLSFPIRTQTTAKYYLVVMATLCCNFQLDMHVNCSVEIEMDLPFSAAILSILMYVYSDL